MLAFVVHAGVLWAGADTGAWALSVAGILAVLAATGVAGLLRPADPSWRLVRGGLAMAIAVLVGDLVGDVSALSLVWFLAMALLYPMLLPHPKSAGAVPIIAGTYVATVYLGSSGLSVASTALRGVGVLGVGLAGLALGRAMARRFGELDEAENEFRRSRGVLDKAFEMASTGMALIDLNGVFVRVNQAMADLLGRSQESVVGLGWGSVVHPDDVRTHVAKVDELVKGEVWSYQEETRFRLLDRKVRTGVVGMSLVADETGRPRYIFAQVTNITDRARSEQRLRDSEAHYRELSDLAPVPLWQLDLTDLAGLLGMARNEGVVDLDDYFDADAEQLERCAAAIRFVDLNDLARRLFRVADAEGFAEMAAEGYLGDGYLDLVRSLVGGIWEERDWIEASVVLRGPTGFNHEGQARLVIPDREGKADHARALLSFTDLTESLRTRSQLQQVEQRLRTVMAAAPIVLFAVDRNGVFTLSEGQGLAALGLAPGEAVGRSVFEMYRDAPAVIQSMRRSLGGESFTTLVPVGDLAFETRYSPIWEDGTVTGVIGVGYDVSARIQANDRLRQLVRSKDEFVATVSHELRTPLTAVVGFAHELRDEFDRLSKEEVEAFVGLIGDQAMEVSDLVEDLLVASRIELDEVTVVRDAIDLWAQVDAVLAARRLGTQVVTERDDTEAKVFGDPVRVRQIFRNLLTNADRHGGDHITVRVVRRAETLSLYVIDDGDGVPETERAKIFEPYYRAHEVEGVTESVGLGLTVSRQLAHLMEGELTYTYHQGHSFFELRLPAA